MNVIQRLIYGVSKALRIVFMGNQFKYNGRILLKYNENVGDSRS